MASEERSEYTSDAPSDGTLDDPVAALSARDGAADEPIGTALTALEEAARRLAHLGLDQLPDTAVDQLLDRLRRPLHQLEGVRARAAALSQSHALARAGNAPSGATVRDHQRRLATDHQLTPSEVQQQIEAGRAARDNAATAQALADGEVGSRHAQRIARALIEVPAERRAAVEQELLELAARMDALAFGRAVRRLQARESPRALAIDEKRRQLDRSFRGTDTEDGGFAFSGLLYGVAAEHARVALDAFRRPDTRHERRTPQQRGADAFEQLCAAALRSGDAPTQHGVRPHVTIFFTAAQFAALRGDPDETSGLLAVSGNAVSGRELRSLVDDCDLLRVVIDAEGIPIEVSSPVRTVPMGLWRALLARDGGCVWEGCTAPASWCDVAHGDRAFAAGGNLSVENAMLLCRRHHRRFDQGSYAVTIEGDRVTITRAKGEQAAVTDGERNGWHVAPPTPDPQPLPGFGPDAGGPDPRGNSP